jgi:hypothetical protein
MSENINLVQISRKVLRLGKNCDRIWRELTKQEKMPFVGYCFSTVKNSLKETGTFKYCWFIHDGYMGEGRLVEIKASTKGVEITHRWKGQLGDSPKVIIPANGRVDSYNFNDVFYPVDDSSSDSDS